MSYVIVNLAIFSMVNILISVVIQRDISESFLSNLNSFNYRLLFALPFAFCLMLCFPLHFYGGFVNDALIMLLPIFLTICTLILFIFYFLFKFNTVPFKFLEASDDDYISRMSRLLKLSLYKNVFFVALSIFIVIVFTFVTPVVFENMFSQENILFRALILIVYFIVLLCSSFFISPYLVIFLPLIFVIVSFHNLVGMVFSVASVSLPMQILTVTFVAILFIFYLLSLFIAVGGTVKYVIFVDQSKIKSLILLLLSFTIVVNLAVILYVKQKLKNNDIVLNIY